MTQTQTQVQTCTWYGESGLAYTYFVHPIGTRFTAVPGNYIFARVTSGLWEPIYVGQSSNLSERFEDHHKMGCIRGYGATHVHAHSNWAGPLARFAEETDIRRSYRPPCNEQ